MQRYSTAIEVLGGSDDRRPIRANLFSLPGELRNAIYLLATEVNADHAIVLSKPQPLLSRVNRQLRSEVLAAYYSSNIFTIPPGQRFWDFICRHNPQSSQCPLRHVRRIQVFVDFTRLVETLSKPRMALKMICLFIEVVSDGKSFHVVPPFSVTDEERRSLKSAVGRMLGKDEDGLYSGLSLVRFAVEALIACEPRLH
jgi:hypothetical protein